MSYFLVDEQDRTVDLASNRGMDELLEAGLPKLRDLVESGEVSEAERGALIAELEESSYEHLAIALRQMSGTVVVSNGVIEAGDEDDDPADLHDYHLPEEHEQESHGNWSEGGDGEADSVGVGKDFGSFGGLSAEKKSDFLTRERLSVKNQRKEKATIAVQGELLEFDGDATTISIPHNVVLRLISDGDAILTHNHPSQVTEQSNVLGLSTLDLRAASKMNLKQIRAIAQDKRGGATYLFALSRPSSTFWPSESAIDDFVYKIDGPVMRLAAERDKRITAKLRSSGPEEAMKLKHKMLLAFTHARAKLVADYFGLEYEMKRL